MLDAAAVLHTRGAAALAALTAMCLADEAGGGAAAAAVLCAVGVGQGLSDIARLVIHGHTFECSFLE